MAGVSSHATPWRAGSSESQQMTPGQTRCSLGLPSLSSLPGCPTILEVDSVWNGHFTVSVL